MQPKPMGHGEANGESDKARLDRELTEFLNELRVALPGIQILFAFLLIVPFSNGFSRIDDLDRDVYMATFLCATAATTLLIAPSAYHRLRWRAHDKEHMLRTANWLAISGTVFLALAITGTVFLITHVVLGGLAAGLITAVAAGWTAWFWFGLPLARRRYEAESPPSVGGSSAGPASPAGGDGGR
jgi:hypothetical protein